MFKQKRIKSLLFGLFVYLICISNVKALTFDEFEVTWYYRNKSNENNLLNVLKDQDTPLYASSSEYVNGFTTRVEMPFVKDVQYIVNFRLQMYYYIGQDGNFRSDTIDRLTKYSYVDTDFKLLNTEVKQVEYECESSSLCIRTFNISQQVLALNNTDAIRFGVYTTDNISIGFYNHTQEIDYIMLNNINITDNANSTIIDQNNQIINGQNNIQNSIINTQDNINQNIDDMEQSIVDSNKETQDVIKDQFNSCRDSYNLFDKNSVEKGYFYNSTGEIMTSGNWGIIQVKVKPNTNYFYLTGNNYNNTAAWHILLDENKNFIKTVGTYKNVHLITTTENTAYIGLSVALYSESNDLNTIMLNEGSTAKPYEPYGEEICTNKLDEQNETQKGIWATIKELPTMFLDMLLGLFIPDDLSFIDNFKDVISNKLGFIASIPIQIIDFMLGLADVAFSEITTINFPSIEIFGVHFWNAEDIDITILLEKLKPFKYFTDLTCVILCCRTLYNFYHSFTGGDAN